LIDDPVRSAIDVCDQDDSLEVSAFRESQWVIYRNAGCSEIFKASTKPRRTWCSKMIMFSCERVRSPRKRVSVRGRK
jgi:hypothetical protein